MVDFDVIYPPYPVKPDRPSISRDATAQEAAVYANEMVVYEKALQEYQEALKVYHEACAVIDDKLRTDMLTEVGLITPAGVHPKADAVWSLAWDYGHHAGYREVMHYLADLARLVL